MSETIIADGTVETPSVEELQERLQKAEAKIVDLKKSTKDTPKGEEKKVEVKTETENSNFMTREEFETERFLETNSELAEHKEALKEYQKKGVSLEEAKILILAKDPTIKARETAQKMNFTSGTPDFNKTEYTQEELANLNQSEYNKVMKAREQGKVIIK